MRPTPHHWLATLLLVLIPLVGACAGSAAKSVTIPTPTATAGDVALSLDRAKYTTHQPIGVTVANASKTSWYAKDGLSACTYLQLEWYDASKKAWTPVDGCTSAVSPQVRLIAPGGSLPFTFAPGDSPADANAWVPGLYRVSLIASTNQDVSGSLTVVYSTGFQING